jgi:tetratricopeptide (TPR) repeat protein
MARDSNSGSLQSQEDTNRYIAHIERGWHWLEKGDAQAARRSAQAAIAIASSNPEAQMLLAAACMALDEPKAALAAFAAAIEADPEFIEPHLGIVELHLFALEDPRAALRYCREIEKIESLSTAEAIELDLLECEAHHQLGDSKKLAQVLDESAALDQLATIAAAIYGDSVERENQDENEHGESILPHLIAEYGDLEPEELDDDETEQLVSRMVPQIARLSKFHVEFGDMGLAKEMAASLVVLLPDSPESWEMLADTAFGDDDPAAGVQASIRALELSSSEPVPEWAPSIEDVTQWTKSFIEEFGAEYLPDAFDEKPPALWVQDFPSPEVIFDGLHPRAFIRVAAVHTEHGQAPIITAIIVYRASLCKLAGSPDRFRQTLIEALDHELDAFVEDAEFAGLSGLHDESCEASQVPQLSLVSDSDKAKSPFEIPAKKKASAKKAKPAAKLKTKTAASTQKSDKSSPKSETKKKTSAKQDDQPSNASPKKSSIGKKKKRRN